jgi:8-oxo-dGTP diphosphatase
MVYSYDYPRPCVSVDSVVFKRSAGKTEVLLIKRGNPPYQGMWAFPGGFLEMDETLEDCAHRELFEETGLKGIKLSQLYAFGDVHRDPRCRLITVAYYGFVDEVSKEIKGGDDALEARWFDLDQLPRLAFDHDKILEKALEKIAP